MGLIFIEVHTDATGTGAGGNEIVPSGWYSVSEAIGVLKAARKALKAIEDRDALFRAMADVSGE